MNQLDREPRLQLLLERCLRDEPGVPGAILRIETPETAWAGAAGFCEPRSQSAARVVFSQLRPVATLVRDVLPLLRRL